MASRNLSSFKYLYSLVFKNEGDLSKIPDKVRKTPIKCFVKESHPYFLVTDDFFYVPCYFTKKAVENFKSNYSNVNITDLRSKVILIMDWSLELARVKSEDVFTSYGGVELKLIVNSFKTPDSSSDSISLNRHPLNIYRDNEMKTLINQYIYNAQVRTVAAGLKSESLPDIGKFTNKGNVSAGVVKFASGESFSNFGFKEGKTAVLDSNALLKADKGAGALKSGGDSSKAVKPKVKGGLVAKKKAIKKTDVSGLAAKIARYSPGGKEAAKKSTARVGPKALATPGEDLSGAGTTEVRSMRQFKKLVDWHKKQKGKK
jgi:hypothetical protein